MDRPKLFSIQRRSEPGTAPGTLIAPRGHIATLFTPLGFMASLYGMNFDRSVSAWNMPELGWRPGYPFALAVMATSAVGTLKS